MKKCNKGKIIKNEKLKLILLNPSIIEINNEKKTEGNKSFL